METDIIPYVYIIYIYIHNTHTYYVYIYIYIHIHMEIDVIYVECCLMMFDGNVHQHVHEMIGDTSRGFDAIRC